MALQPTRLTVVKSDVAAEIVATAVWSAAAALAPGDPVMESARRLLRRHARELLELHDSINDDEVLPAKGTPADPLATIAQAPEGYRDDTYDPAPEGYRDTTYEQA